MKRLIWLAPLACAMASPMSAAMMIAPDAEHENAKNEAHAAMPTGKVDAISTTTRKIVIDGVTYVYSPSSTVITVNGRRGRMSDIHSGDTVEFQLASQRSGKTASLSALTLRRR